MQALTNPIGWLRSMLSDVTRGLEWFSGRYYGVYEGRVVDNADPGHLGRIRAMCPAIGINKPEDVAEDFWMLPSMPGLGTDPETGQTTGVYHPPDVGTNVWVMFRHGLPKYPIYIGGWLTDKTESDTFDSEAALKKGIRTKTGHFIRMDDDADNLSLTIGRGDGEGGETPMFLSFTKEGHTIVTNILGSTLFMNGEKPETSLMTANKKGEVTALLMLGDDKITLATKSGGAYGINGKDHTITGDNVIADCNKEFVANAGTVRLGKNAKEPAVLGMKFMQWSLLHQHLVSAPVPNAPCPINPAIPPPVKGKELSTKVFVS